VCKFRAQTEFNHIQLSSCLQISTAAKQAYSRSCVEYRRADGKLGNGVGAAGTRAFIGEPGNVEPLGGGNRNHTLFIKGKI